MKVFALNHTNEVIIGSWGSYTIEPGAKEVDIEEIVCLVGAFACECLHYALHGGWKLNRYLMNFFHLFSQREEKKGEGKTRRRNTIE
jgi:hypothetical protein